MNLLPRDAYELKTMEAKKHADRQTVDGHRLVTFTIHDNDIPMWLLKAPPGTPVALGIVAIDYDNPDTPAPKSDGDKAVDQAAMLCKQPLFQQYLAEQSGDLLMLDTVTSPEDIAAERLRNLLDIESRSELRNYEEARKLFNELMKDFNSWAKGSMVI